MIAEKVNVIEISAWVTFLVIGIAIALVLLWAYIIARRLGAKEKNV